MILGVCDTTEWIKPTTSDVDLQSATSQRLNRIYKVNILVDAYLTPCHWNTVDRALHQRTHTHTHERFFSIKYFENIKKSGTLTSKVSVGRCLSSPTFSLQVSCLGFFSWNVIRARGKGRDEGGKKETYPPKIRRRCLFIIYASFFFILGRAMGWGEKWWEDGWDTWTASSRLSSSFVCNITRAKWV